MSITGCAAVSLSNLVAMGMPGLHVVDSSVTAQNCSLGGTGTLPTNTSLPGAIVDNSMLSAVSTSFAASSGGPVMLPEAGLVINGSVVAVARGARSAIRASSAGSLPMEAVRGSGVLIIDPSVPVVPLAGAARTFGVAEVATVLPGLGAQIGISQARTSLYSPASDLFVLLVGRPGPPAGFSFPRELWLDPMSIQIVSAGVQGASGLTQLDLLLPGILPPGTSLGFQALSGPISALELTPPAIVVTP